MDNNFRVCVLFKSENKLNGKKFYIYIDLDNFKTIKHVEQHIISLFKLDKIKLSINDVLLPKNETVHIINPKDILVVTQTLKKCNGVKNEEIINMDVADNAQILDILSQELVEKCKSLKTLGKDGDDFLVAPKKKRKRTRKKKTSFQVEETSPVVMEEVFLSPMSNGKHVRFDDSIEIINDEVPETPNIETPSQQNDDDWKQNLLNLSKCKKVFSRTQEETNHINTEKSEINEIESPKTNDIIEQNGNISIESIDIDKCPVINKYEINNTILFKKLVLDQNYCPNHSEYVLAKIISMDDLDNIRLKILDNAEALYTPQGKFSLDDEEPVNPFITSSVSELIDVRLVN